MEDYMWRVFEFTTGFGQQIVMSNRAMSEQEKNTVFDQMTFDVDFNDLGLDYMYGTNFGTQCFSFDDKETALAVYKESIKKGHLLTFSEMMTERNK